MKRQAKSYSIVDHELLHGGHLGRLTHKALALYLFLVVVSDWEGKSYYSRDSIAQILRMESFDICRAKDELLTEGLIAYKKPYWWVLTLTQAKKSGTDDIHPFMMPLVRKVIEKRRV